jgi:phage RecT family recombinase
MANELTIYESTLSKQLARQWSKHKAEPDLQWAAEKQYALNILRKSEVLQKSSPESFAMAMLDVAFTGLSLSPTLGLAYLIPYWNKQTSTFEVQFKPSYKGMQQLVYKAGTVVSAQAVLVRAKDSFQVQTINNRRVIHHVEHSSDRDDVIAAYVILKYANGGEHVEVMNRSELNAVEAQAKSQKGGGAVWNGPWKGEMQKKAVLRRALKHAPLDSGGRMERALEVADKYDPMAFDPIPEPKKETAPTVLVSDDQALEVHATLTDRGLTADQADTWLHKIAEAMGYGCFADLPADRFEEAKTRLIDRLNKVKSHAPAG